MADDVLYKTPSEKVVYDYDFSPKLPTNDSSITLAVSAIDEEGTSSSAVVGTSSTSGTTGTVPLQAGSDGKDYTVTMRATGATSGAIRDWVIEMRVRTKVGGVV
jgi:hypothetical protein